MIVLNLGCGSKTSDHTSVVNIDWSILLRLRKNPLLRPLASAVLRGDRRARFDQLPENILVHDLSKGIPFGNETVDVVYNSHMLEHLDRDIADGFLKEALRVLKPGGIHRIVVPDLESLCRDYLKHLDRCLEQQDRFEDHDQYIAEILEQCVRKEAAGTSQQPPLRRWLENALLGDARQRGETHQWMYDRVNLTQALYDAGYHSVSVHDYETSDVPVWSEIRLDSDAAGVAHKPGSLYLEASKPPR